MRCILDQETLLQGLNQVIGGVEKKQTMPILGNVLLVSNESTLMLTATDLEIQLETKIQAQAVEDGQITVNARKLHDITRSLPAGEQIQLSVEQHFLHISCGNSVFKLSTLPAEEFPQLKVESNGQSISLQQSTLAKMLNLTHFSMANQDVRYFLNGMLMELSGTMIRCVSTDGHRLSLAEHSLKTEQEHQQIIIPRKTIIELMRALNADAEEALALNISQTQIRTSVGNLSIIGKLIEGRFPDYQRVIPEQNSIETHINRAQLKSVLQRAAVLSSDKNAGAQFYLHDNQMEIESSNNENEQSKEMIEIEYNSSPLKIAFNIGYFNQLINAVDAEELIAKFENAESSALIYPADTSEINCRYVLMPMKI